MPGMVGVAGEYRAGAVKLLGKDEAGYRVSQGERPEGENESSAEKSVGWPTIGGADGENHVLRAFLTLRAHPGRE